MDCSIAANISSSFDLRRVIRKHAITLSTICRVITGEKVLREGQALYGAPCGSLVLLPSQRSTDIETFQLMGSTGYR